MWAGGEVCIVERLLRLRLSCALFYRGCCAISVVESGRIMVYESMVYYYYP